VTPADRCRVRVGEKRRDEADRTGAARTRRTRTRAARGGPVFRRTVRLVGAGAAADTAAGYRPCPGLVRVGKDLTASARRRPPRNRRSRARLSEPCRGRVEKLPATHRRPPTRPLIGYGRAPNAVRGVPRIGASRLRPGRVSCWHRAHRWPRWRRNPPRSMWLDRRSGRRPAASSVRPTIAPVAPSKPSVEAARRPKLTVSRAVGNCVHGAWYRPDLSGRQRSATHHQRFRWVSSRLASREDTAATRTPLNPAALNVTAAPLDRSQRIASLSRDVRSQPRSWLSG